MRVRIRRWSVRRTLASRGEQVAGPDDHPVEVERARVEQPPLDLAPGDHREVHQRPRRGIRARRAGRRTGRAGPRRPRAGPVHSFTFRPRTGRTARRGPGTAPLLQRVSSASWIASAASARRLALLDHPGAWVPAGCGARTPGGSRRRRRGSCRSGRRRSRRPRRAGQPCAARSRSLRLRSAAAALV